MVSAILTPVRGAVSSWDPDFAHRKMARLLQASAQQAMSQNATNEAILNETLPNWTLIDEVSVPLLESGVAQFSTLQAILPSILALDANSAEAAQRCRKLLRISQLHIEHLLKSQHHLLEKIAKLEDNLKIRRKEAKQLKADVMQDIGSFFECSSCGKVFLNQHFLACHLLQKHKDNMHRISCTDGSS